MCLVFAAFTGNSESPLLVLFNRDETYTRLTAPLCRWSDQPSIIGGRDLQRGGSWAAVRDDGTFACVTFVREPYGNTQDRQSRGLLVTDFLSSERHPMDYLEELQASPDRYWGYNILLGNKDEVFHYSNRYEGITRVQSGIHGLSNASLNTPWPKVQKGKRQLELLIERNSWQREDLLQLMQDDRQAPDCELPSTGIALDKERKLSSLFVRMSTYGTRTTSLIEFNSSGGGSFVEWTHEFNSSAPPIERTELF